jgi:plasmid stabilization system protein ParE
MKVHWTDTAEAHVEAIHAYTAVDSPEYTKRMVDRLTRRSQQIAEFPSSGRLPMAAFGNA